MAVVSTPVSARVKFTYLNPSMPPQRISGINPAVNAFQVSQLVNALHIIQAGPVLDGFLTREIDIEEN